MIRVLGDFRVHREQISSVLRATPYAMLGYAATMALAVGGLKGQIPDGTLLLWSLFALVLSAYVGLRAVRRRNAPVFESDDGSPLRSPVRAILFAVLLALPWAVIGTIGAGAVESESEVILIALVVGMAATGSILLAPLPAAALVYIVTMILPPAFKLLFVLGNRHDIVLGGIALSFSVVLIVLVLVNARLFLERVEAIVQLKQSVRDLNLAREETERAAQAKSDFLATMSHEIRTPLNCIIGYTNLVLGRNALKTEDAQDLTIVKDAGKALLGVVNDVLDFSTIEAGQLKLVRVPTLLEPIVESCLTIVAVEARAKGLELRAELDPPIARQPLLADASRIRQVLLNLLYNAVKFTSSGEVVVRAASIDDGEQTMRVRFTVSDTGPGIPSGSIPSLFSRFSQLDTGRERRFGGSGLGLAICKRIVEAQGGDIGVESTFGRGSMFWFEIPFERTTEPALAAADATAAQPAIRRRLNVLVVDDMEPNRRLTSTVLTRAGHSVKTAASGAEAILSVQTEDFDVVLMDIQMPGMNGLAATKALKNLLGPASSLPVVGMTANVLPDEIAHCRAAGMAAHIGKPFELSELIRTIESVADAAKATRDGAASNAKPAVHQPAPALAS
jgi:signal transduction histidine kinase/FixJ family two-component response regulator